MIATLPVATSSDILIRGIAVYKDGGTVELTTNLGIYCIDHRVRSKTPDRVYNAYPTDVGAKIVNDDLAGRIKRAYLATHG